MDSTFGARLKAQRESQNVTLETIAERTKVRVAFLDGLERDDISLWPRGIFRRSYVYGYAAAIGLDAEQTFREFLAIYPDVVVEPEATVAAADDDRPGRRPPMRLQYLIASALGAFTHRPHKSAEPPAAVAAPPETIAEPTPLQVDAPSVHESPASLDEAFELTSPEFVVVREPAAIDLPAMAQLCTRVVEASCVADLQRLLEEAAIILHATGVIVWLWDAKRSVLWPSLSHGYSRQAVARLPALAADADNPIGSAFRSMACQIVKGSASGTGAIVAPIMTPGGSAGVLAIECPNGFEHDASLQALVTIFAAQLSLLVEAAPIVRTAIA